MNKIKNALVLSVGGTIEPLIKCIEEFKPDCIYLLHSEGSFKEALELCKITGFEDGNKSKFKQVYNHESLQEAFYRSREIIRELKKENYQVIVDFTGGTKPMVAGLVLAAIGEECNYSYVGSVSKNARDKNGLGIVKSGFEKIKNQKNPYSTYAVLEFDKGIDFFNRYQFEAAYENFEAAESKLEDSRLKKQSQLYLKLVKFYDTWDKFYDYIDNEELPIYLDETILSRINNNSNLFNHFSTIDLEFYNQIKKNIEFLNLKIAIGDKSGDKFVNKIRFYLPDLLNNANRRIEERKYDDAVARLYRAVELIAQLNLKELGLIDINKLKTNRVFHINKDIFQRNVDDDIWEMVDEWNPLYWNNSKKNSFKLTLVSSYTLLDALGVSLAKQYLENGNLKGRVEKRNNSIMAHGLKPVDKKSAIELYNLVLNFAKDYWQDIEYYMNISKFPKFNLD